jgi:geranylgeranyl diphosphate synthase type II
MNYEDRIDNYRSTFEMSFHDFLKNEADKKQIPPKLYEAMAYSLLTEGKRVRPILCMAGAELSGIEKFSEKVLPIAVALEFFHTSTLIHDDLPCMDNDELRRGKPTCHVMYGEALALLAGDAIPLLGMKHAVEGLIKNQIPLENIINALIVFLESAGATGVLGGQSLDIESDKVKDMEDIIITTSMKTGDLIKASVKTGAVIAGISGEELKSVDSYGYYLGTCFQIIDDILDETASAMDIGKTPGKDKKQGKSTFVSLLGVEEARMLAENCTSKAINALNECFSGEDGEFLRDFAKNLLNRAY